MSNLASSSNSLGETPMAFASCVRRDRSWSSFHNSSPERIASVFFASSTVPNLCITTSKRVYRSVVRTDMSGSKGCSINSRKTGWVLFKSLEQTAVNVPESDFSNDSTRSALRLDSIELATLVASE